MSAHILLAYSISDSQKAKALTYDEVSQNLKAKKLTWVHMDADHPQTKVWLKDYISHFDPFIIDTLLAEETRPRMMQVEDSALLILRGMNFNDKLHPEDMISVRIWVDKNHIISTSKDKLQSILDIEKKLKTGKGPINSGEFIYMLVSRLFERMQPVLGELDEATGNIEEELLELVHTSLRESIVEVRKQSIAIRRYMIPQREAINQLCTSELDWLDDTHKRHLQESYNHVTRYIEDLESIRERSQVVKDELSNILTDKLNRNMYILSIISAIFLPLGFLTGLLGVNIGGIPGTNNKDAFLIFCVLLAIIILIQAILFKKFKWY